MDLHSILLDLSNKCIAEINDSDDIKQPIKEKVLKPLINYILEQIYPYLIISVIIFALTLLVAIIILVLIIKSSYNSNTVPILSTLPILSNLNSVLQSSSL